MRVNPDDQAAGVTGIAGRSQTRSMAQALQLASDHVDLAKAQALERAWAQAPAVRADKVARAKALVNDPSYPSQEVMAKMASRIAERLTGE